MKKIQLVFTGATFAIIIMIACQKAALREPNDQQNNVINPATAVTGNSARGDILPETGSCNPNAYVVTLESHSQVGSTWEWVWSVQNSNPGNGNGGTIQDLSHWGMQFGPCNVMSSVVGAAYSSNGVTWTNFTPVYEVDPNQGCMTTPVLKFDYGTTGSAKSYYKLIVNNDFEEAASNGYYKSGVKTGCCTFTFQGIGCLSEGGVR
jgi:hypothetical protein